MVSRPILTVCPLMETMLCGKNVGGGTRTTQGVANPALWGAAMTTTSAASYT